MRSSAERGAFRTHAMFPDFDPATGFALTSSRETLTTHGIRRSWAARYADIAPAVATFLARQPVQSATPVIVGVLPFDLQRPAHLFEPGRIVLTATPPAESAPAARMFCRVTPVPTREVYERAVLQALARMELPVGDDARPALKKVVLARSLRIEAPRPFDARQLFERLRADHRVSAFSVPLPDDERGARVLVGATPELLLQREGTTVTSMPLAGSARRHREPQRDRHAGEALLRSDKDLREHATVVDWIADALAPHCVTLTVQSHPNLVSTSSMWHLATRIVGELRTPAPSSLELAAALHPTPAVCGVPVEHARATIAALEPFERGFFTGTVGWCAANGDGRWFVAIRCAEIADRTATLYAGAGIVPGSTPEAEADETSAKFLALLDALAVDEQGHPVGKDGR